MSTHTNLLVGLGLGALLMYIFDPDRGRRRRSLLHDQLLHGAHEIDHFGGDIAARSRHLRNRTRGMVIETKTRLRREEVDDPVLEARVRSQLGRLTANPSHVAVSAEHGRVTLRGTAGEAEMEALIEGVQDIPGVHDVINRMTG